MKLEESLINKITEAENNEKWGKYLKNTIAVYDIDAFVKQECGEEYEAYDYKFGGAAIFTQSEGSGKCCIVDNEAIGLRLNDVNEEFKIGVNDKHEGNSIPIMAKYTIEVSIKDILEKGKSKPTDFETFFDRRNYNSRCQENFDELMNYLNDIGVLKGNTETSEVYEESKEERKVKGIYTVDNSHSVLVYDINYGIDDEVEWALSNDQDNIQTSIIEYAYEDDEGPLEEPRAFFMVGDMRVYLDEVMRTDLTESVEKLEEDEIATLDTKVKEWMLKNYPGEEDFIVDMPEDLTFRDVHERMLKHEDIYEIIQTDDSTDREDVFNGLCEATGYDYDYFYYLWLYGPEDEKFLKEKEKISK